jgi:2-oxoglutarate ferredoxin oxidoreductase subunit alpha
MAESYLTEDADIVVVAYGATARIVKSAVNKARGQGIKVGMFRPITLWPFPVEEINQAVKGCKSVLCVEMSTGQMIDDVKLAINCSKPVSFFGRTGGVIPTPNEVYDKIIELGGVN